MSDNTKSDGTGFALGVVFTLVLLAVALVFGIAMSSGKKAFAKKRVVAEQPVQVVPENAVIMLSELTSANATRNTTAVVEKAQIILEKGVMSAYFEVGQSSLDTSNTKVPAEFVAALAEGQKAVVTGYVDNTGDAAVNAELSKNRALAVRDALVAAGLAVDRIELRKPADIQAGDDANARRVDVTVE